MRFSELFLTLCIEQEKMLRDEWRKRGPQIGDWCTPKDPAEPGHGLAFLIGSKSRRFYRLYSSEGTQRWSLLAEHLIEDFILLPSQRQLQEMLEERGHRNYTLGAWSNEKEEARYLVQDFDHPDQKQFFGLDPETPLLRALVEVVKGG